jgi:hypothetical protein
MTCRRWFFAGLMGLGLLTGTVNSGWVPVASAQSVPSRSEAHDDSAAALFPADSLAFVEVARPDELVQTLVNHPVIRQALELEPAQAAMRSSQYLQFRLGLAFAEGQLGATWQDLVQKLAGGGIAAAVGSDGRSVCLVVRSNDEPLLKRTLGTLLSFVDSQAKNAGGKSPYRVEEDGDAKLALFRDFTLVRRGADLVAGTDRVAVLRLLGKLRGEASADNGLAARPELAAEASVGPPAIRVWADLDRVRQLGLARELFRGMADNPATELVLGGVLEALQDSPWLTAEVRLDGQNLELAIDAALESEKVASSREYFFGPDGLAAAPTLVDDSQMLASISTWRDLSGWWLSKEDLFDENTVAQLVQADSQISTLFSGLDFGGEVLGALQPGMQLVVDHQEYPESVQPDIRLPAFALIGQLKQPEAMGRRFKVAFQSTMGFVNLGIAEQGQPQYDVNTQNTADGCVCTSQVLPEADAPRNLMAYNFSPTLVVKGDRLILSSTAGLAERLQGAGAAPAKPVELDQSSSGNRIANTLIRLDLQGLARVLDANREALVANNMMEKGHGHEAAESAIGAGLELVRLFHDLEVRLEKGEGRLGLVTRIGFQDSTASPAGE